MICLPFDFVSMVITSSIFIIISVQLSLVSQRLNKNSINVKIYYTFHSPWHYRYIKTFLKSQFQILNWIHMTKYTLPWWPQWLPLDLWLPGYRWTCLYRWIGPLRPGSPPASSWWRIQSCAHMKNMSSLLSVTIFKCQVVYFTSIKLEIKGDSNRRKVRVYKPKVPQLPGQILHSPKRWLQTPSWKF